MHHKDEGSREGFLHTIRGPVLCEGPGSSSLLSCPHTRQEVPLLPPALKTEALKLSRAKGAALGRTHAHNPGPSDVSAQPSAPSPRGALPPLRCERPALGPLAPRGSPFPRAQSPGRPPCHLLRQRRAGSPFQSEGKMLAVLPDKPAG